MTAKILMCRYPAMLEYLADELGIRNFVRVNRIDFRSLSDGDIIIATLSPDHIATICSRGARYFHLFLYMDRELKYKNPEEITMTDIAESRPRIEQFSAEHISGHDVLVGE